ncbi:MAG: hypothetical protein O7H41_08675 [Planctomycetota bacterium]|nr:hypothetical protein [Planctomycetota bacterium]
MPEENRPILSTVFPALRRVFKTGRFKTFPEELRKERAEYFRQRLAKREVSVKIDRGWAWICRSPLAVIPRAFSGVSFSFAPYFLYLYGQGRTPLGPVLPGMVICWATIAVPLLFYMGLGNQVIEWLKHSREQSSESSA